MKYFSVKECKICKRECGTIKKFIVKLIFTNYFGKCELHNIDIYKLGKEIDKVI